MKRDEHGATAVEFAIVLPMLCILIFGTLAFGAVFSQNLELNNAAGTTARLGSTGDMSCTELTDHAVAMANGGVATADKPIVAGDVAINVGGGGCVGPVPCLGSAENASVLVTITYQSEVMDWIPVIPPLGDVEVIGHGEFRCESQ